MQKNISGFTLLEIMTASMILSIWVFGIYKMMSSNNVLLSDWNTKQEAQWLFIPFQNCLENIWYESLSWSYNVGNSFSINFWEDNLSCLTGSVSPWGNSFSGVILWKNTFFLTAEVAGKNDEKITLNTNVFSEIYGNMSQSGKTIEIIKN